MLFAVMDGKIVAVRMVVMEGFEGNLREGVIGDTGDCECSKNVDEEVRLYGVWDIALFADGKIAAVRMVVMEGFEDMSKSCGVEDWDIVVGHVMTVVERKIDQNNHVVLGRAASLNSQRMVVLELS